MGIFDLIFGKKETLPFTKIVSFERVESDFQIEIGDQVSLWNKPNTNQVNLDAKGSVGGDGLVGVTRNDTISEHLSETKFIFVENKIQKGNLQIRTISTDQINEFYDKIDEAIWLEDKNGVKLDAENRIRNGWTEKTLKAVFTGHKLEIKEFKKDHNWYYIIVGVSAT